mgnify:CR=1 FL=1
MKLIDFGLAKLDRTDLGSTATESLSAAQFNTAEGVVMGTAAHMSPEQVRGRVVDSRSDIFSFGAVLFEMLTGSRAFSGQSSIETMNAILKEDPPEIDVSRVKIAPDLERVLRHCLEKDPAGRFQSARDLAFALSATSGSQSSAVLRATGRRGLPSWLPWALAGAFAVLAGAFWLVARLHTSRGERMEFAIPMKDETGNLAISADGRMLVYAVPDESVRCEHSQGSAHWFRYRDSPCWHRRGNLSILLARRPVCRLLRCRQAEKVSASGDRFKCWRMLRAVEAAPGKPGCDRVCA